MGYDELINELGREAEEKIEAARRRAEEELVRLKRDTAAELDRLRQECETGRSVEAEETTRSILAEARQEVLTIRLDTDRELTDRLHSIALELLEGLRGDGYSEMFAELVAELPDFKWETVRVNPRDKELASNHFPDAEIVVDETVCGGLDVSGADDTVCINNTLEKRLHRLWPDLLPDMVAAVYKEIDRDAFAADR